MRFLIIEDEKIIRTTLQKFIREKYPEAKFVECENGRKGIDLYEADKDFDVILVDYVMPEATGMEVVRHIRQERGDKKTPVVMITSLHKRKTVMEMIEMGVTDYIKKPFEKERLLGKLEKIINRLETENAGGEKAGEAEKKPQSIRHAQIGDDVIDDTEDVSYVDIDADMEDDSDAVEISDSDIL